MLKIFHQLNEARSHKLDMYIYWENTGCWAKWKYFSSKIYAPIKCLHINLNILTRLQSFWLPKSEIFAWNPSIQMDVCIFLKIGSKIQKSPYILSKSCLSTFIFAICRQRISTSIGLYPIVLKIQREMSIFNFLQYLSSVQQEREFKSKFYWVSVHLVDIVLNFNQRTKNVKIFSIFSENISSQSQPP